MGQITLRLIKLQSLLVGISLCLTANLNAQLAPGDILAGYSGAAIEAYSATGSPIQNYPNTGSATDYWRGIAVTPIGNILTTYSPFISSPKGSSSGVDIFSPAGIQLATFPIASTGSHGLSVFPDGTLIISDTADSQMLEYSQTGILLRTIPLPHDSLPYGCAISPSDGTVWCADFGTGSLYHLNESGIILNTIYATGQPKDIAIANDGSLFITQGMADLVYHYAADGDILGNFPDQIGVPEGISMS